MLAAHAVGLGGTPADEKSRSAQAGFLCLEAIVQVPNPLAHLVEQAGDCNTGVPGFMENLYLRFCTAYGLETQCASGLRQVFKNDVSSSAGCINRVLRSTLR